MKTVRLINGDEEIPVGKIFCVGRNYREHAAEMKADVPTVPVIFLKPTTALIHSGEDIVIPTISKDIHHEGEMVALIGSGGRNLKGADARRAVIGYGVGLDMTLRDIQSAAKQKGLPWTVAKGFDTSAPVSDFLSADTLPPDPSFELVCSVNGRVKQRANTSDMIFTVPLLIEFLSSIFTLERGDLLFTGTPEGVGMVRPGDVVEATLAGTVSTRHNVKAA